MAPIHYRRGYQPHHAQRYSACALCSVAAEPSEVAAEATPDLTRNMAAASNTKLPRTSSSAEVKATAKQPIAMYMTQRTTAFRIIENINSQLNHQGITKTHDRIKEVSYEIVIGISLLARNLVFKAFVLCSN